MKTHLAYCSACDRIVRVAWEPGPADDPGRVPHASEVVCLEAGENCTGALCPLFGVPSAEMRERLTQGRDSWLS